MVRKLDGYAHRLEGCDGIPSEARGFIVNGLVKVSAIIGRGRFFAFRHEASDEEELNFGVDVGGESVVGCSV